MPCRSKLAYYQHLDVVLNDQLEQEAKEDIKNAGHRLRECLFKKNNGEDEDSALDAAVSFHSTFAKRGFTSLFSVADLA